MVWQKSLNLQRSNIPWNAVFKKLVDSNENTGPLHFYDFQELMVTLPMVVNMLLIFLEDIYFLIQKSAHWEISGRLIPFISATFLAFDNFAI